MVIIETSKVVKLGLVRAVPVSPGRKEAVVEEPP